MKFKTPRPTALLGFSALTAAVLVLGACGKDTDASPPPTRRLSSSEFVQMAKDQFADFASLDSVDPADYVAVLARHPPSEFGPLLERFMGRVEEQFSRPGQGVQLGLFNYWLANTVTPSEPQTLAAFEALLKLICAHPENGHVRTCESGAPVYQEVVARMRTVAERNGLRMLEIGRSGLFRLPIYALETPRREGKPILWLQANIHGDEHMGIEVIFDTISRRESQGGALKEADFVFIPVVNPDGYVLSTTQIGWRKNGFVQDGVITGVDLNRSFPTPTFQPTSAHEPFLKEYAPAPVGVVEIEALTSYARQIRPAGAIDFHSNQHFIAYDDLAETSTEDSARRTVRLAQGMAQVFLNDKLEPGKYVADSGADIFKVERVHGTFSEWFRKELNAVAFSIELLDPNRLTTWPSEDVRMKAVQGARPALDVFVAEFVK